VSLPASVDDLRGLRAARWVRESTRGQFDTFGPEAQREQQDRTIERYGLTDTGLLWSVAHSGRTIGNTESFRDMLGRAGTAFDVLVVGYVSRFARDLRTAVNARHDLHAAGAAIMFCDERVLTSDDDAWELFAREAVEAEAYSRRLGKRIREGYAAKFRRLGDQAGNAPLGFHRAGPARTLAVDPASIAQAVRVFELYASGTWSIDQVASETRLAPDRVRAMLANPIYNGWMRRFGAHVARNACLRRGDHRPRSATSCGSESASSAIDGPEASAWRAGGRQSTR
jgi:DNA invertase Pin-like site-specific DNA recombinase